MAHPGRCTCDMADPEASSLVDIIATCSSSCDTRRLYYNSISQQFNHTHTQFCPVLIYCDSICQTHTLTHIASRSQSQTRHLKYTHGVRSSDIRHKYAAQRLRHRNHNTNTNICTERGDTHNSNKPAQKCHPHPRAAAAAAAAVAAAASGWMSYQYTNSISANVAQCRHPPGGQAAGRGTDERATACRRYIRCGTRDARITVDNLWQHTEIRSGSGRRDKTNRLRNCINSQFNCGRVHKLHNKYDN